MSKPLHMSQQGDSETLRQHLSDTIGADVMKAMDGVSWEHTQSGPEVPTEAIPSEIPQTDNPAVTPSVTSNTPTPVTPTTGVNWAEFRDANGMILGKYKDESAAAKGMYSLLQMAKTALSERDAALVEANQLRQQTTVTPPAGGARGVEATIEEYQDERLKSILKKVGEGDGLDAEDIPQLIAGLNAQAEQKARAIITEQRTSETQHSNTWKEVDDYVRQHHPVALSHVDEMELFKQTNKEVGRIFNRVLQTGDNGAELDATLYLWNEYSRANPHVLTAPIDPALQAQENTLAAQEQVRRELLETERANAGLLGGSTGSSSEQNSQPTGPSPDELKQAIARKTFDNGQSWRSLTITPTLTHPIFDSL